METGFDRRAVLDAAVILHKMHASQDVAFQSWDPQQDDGIEQMLRRQFERARADLDGFLRSKAARIALDALIPGWRYVDASGFLPREKWHAFVSNERGEWLAWLAEQGVDYGTAEAMIENAFSRP